MPGRDPRERPARAFASTPTVAGDPVASPAPTSRSEATWRRLRVVGIVAPVTFIVALQLLQPLLAGGDGTGEAAVDAITVVATIVFGLVMFRLLDRWYGETLRTNRELAVRDAVATAVRDAGTSTDAVASAAARSVRDAAGAIRVLLDMPGQGSWDAYGALDPEDVEGTDIAEVLAERDAADAGLPVTTLDVPLRAASARVGTLRLWLPTRTATAPDADGSVRTTSLGLTPATVEAVGQQIGSALHRAVLAQELHRTLRAQQAVSRLLVQITTGTPLDRGLRSIVASAADLTGTTRAGLRLHAADVPALHPEPHVTTLCVTPDGVHPCPGTRGACPHRGPGEVLSTPVRTPRGEIGELWVAGGAAVVASADAGSTERPAVLGDLAELTSVALEHARLLEDERSAAAVREREWIAREMHDSLAQVLGVLHLRLRALEALVGSLDDAEEQRELADLADIAHDAFVDVREAILGLRENAAADRSFLDALTSYAAKYTRQSGITARVDTEGDPAGIVLSPAAEVQVLRVVQEALTNVRKHAQARTATVRLRRDGRRVVVQVTDDGVGFATDGAHRFDTFGMSSMRERCELVGGTLAVDSAPGRGTRITASLPAALPAPGTPPHLPRAAAPGLPVPDPSPTPGARP